MHKYMSKLKQSNMVHCRNFSRNSWKMQVKEVKIDTPWGHIAGKWWGPQNTRPVLVLHGWQENCGSFDRLIPLLPNHLGYLAIDLPGHGRSSHIPPGLFYHFMDGPITVKYIKDHFKWPKISMMGHSLGSTILFAYSSLFPETVDFLICMDALNPLDFKNRLDRTAKSMNDFSRYSKIHDSQGEPPAYTQEELEELICYSSQGSINVENAKYIFNRNAWHSWEHPGKYVVSRDIRLKCGSLIGWTLDDSLEASKRMKFPLLSSAASQSGYHEHKKARLEVVEVLEKNNPLFECVNFEGTHHVHLNDPEQVAQKLTPFILKHSPEISEVLKAKM